MNVTDIPDTKTNRDLIRRIKDDVKDGIARVSHREGDLACVQYGTSENLFRVMDKNYEIIGIDEASDDDFSVFQMAEYGPDGLRIVSKPVDKVRNRHMEQLESMLGSLRNGMISGLGISAQELNPPRRFEQQHQQEYIPPTITTTGTGPSDLMKVMGDQSGWVGSPARSTAFQQFQRLQELMDHRYWEAATEEIEAPKEPEQETLAPRRVVEL